MSRQKRTAATNALQRLRKRDTDKATILAEVDDLETAIADQPPKGRYLDIFRSENRKQTLIACMVNFFQQATGQSFSSQYGTLFVKGLGGIDAFTVNMLNNAVNVIGIILCLVLSDRLGRR